MKKVFTEKELEMIKSFNEAIDDTDIIMIPVKYWDIISEKFKNDISFFIYEFPVIKNQFCIRTNLDSNILINLSKESFKKEIIDFLNKNNIHFELKKQKELKNETIQFYVRITK